MFGDLDWPLNATRGFVSIRCAFCLIMFFRLCILFSLCCIDWWIIIMRPSSLGGGRVLRRTLSVRLSVCPSVPLSLPSVTSRHLANYNDTHVLFGTRWGPHIVRPFRPHRFLFLLKIARFVGRHIVGCRDTRTVMSAVKRKSIAVQCFFVWRPTLTADLSVAATHAPSMTAVVVGRQKWRPTVTAVNEGIPKPWRDRQVRWDRYSVCFARPVCLRGQSVCPVCQ